MDLTVIIVNHNAKEKTLNCLRSIYEKTAKIAFEIILVDNHSKDGAAQAVREKYSEVKIIENSINLGFAKANNQGVGIARGRNIIFLNNDCVLKNNALNIMSDYINKNPKIGILTCKLIEPDGRVQKNCRAFPLTPLDAVFGRNSLLSKLFPFNPITKRNTYSNWDYNSPYEIEWVSGAAMMVRREVFEQVGFLDEKYFMYWEDADFCRRVKKFGWRIAYIPEAEIIHFTGAGGTRLSKVSHNLKMIYYLHHSAYYYFIKHYYKRPWHPAAILTFSGMIYLVFVKWLYKILKILIKKPQKLFIPRGNYKNEIRSN